MLEYLHRVRHWQAGREQLTQGGELGARPLGGDHRPARRGPRRDRPVHPRLPDAPAFEILAVALEHPVLGGPVPLGREQAGPAGAGHAAAQQEDVGLLAGLQDAEFGVDGREVGDKPVRVRLRAALGGRGLVPRGPPVTLGQPERLGAEVGRREGAGGAGRA